MRLSNPLRAISTAILCMVLAVGVGSLSAGIALTKKAPETASILFPPNGLAKEVLASRVFTSSVAATSQPKEAAASVKPWAEEAYRNEPLTPKAHTLLARAQDDSTASSEIVRLASQMDRRETMLQAMVLQESVEASNYVGVIETLDRILRVRPSRSNELFEVLLPVFVQEETVEEFAKILDGTSPWHSKFISFALNNPASLLNLYRLRSIRPFDDEAQDKKLIEMLARAGELQLASQLYQQLLAKDARTFGDDRLSWSTTYPPFDWSFADQADLRAQPSLDSTGLEIYIRPGQGGILARRILKVPSAPFSLSLEHRIGPQGAHDDMRLVLKCADSNLQIAEERFGVSEASIAVKKLPSECEFIEIDIIGRAWTGQSAVRGEISPLELR